MRFRLGRALFLVLLAVASPFAQAAEEASDALTLYRKLIPHGELHFRRCWQLEHDYYDLRCRIAETGVVWRRRELELRWEEVRDERRELCLMGW